tara:strand:- start:1887 stop:2207 length:321 start_codon:yes stop_codon:yes gene_type:complete
MTYGKIHEVQRELDMMIRPVPVNELTNTHYQPDRLYSDAMGESRVMQYVLETTYTLPPATAEVNQMAQDALDTLEKRLGPVDPTEKIGGITRESTGMYRIERLDMV